MTTVRVVTGTGGGPTATAAYDAALAAAGIHNYNLVTVSSVVPADASVTVVETAPDLGPVGGRLTVVQGRATVTGGRAVAGLGWTTTAEGGVFYEDHGADAAAVRERIAAGLRSARELRSWSFDADTEEYAIAQAADEGRHTTAVAVAVYGEADPL